jgi:hypothetical protein
VSDAVPLHPGSRAGNHPAGDWPGRPTFTPSGTATSAPAAVAPAAGVTSRGRADTGPQPAIAADGGPAGNADDSAVRARREAGVDDEAPLAVRADDLGPGWQRAKAGFVDNPRGATTEAASLVEEAAERLVAALRARAQEIRDTWDGTGPGRDTEAMRVALLRYQSLFHQVTGFNPATGFSPLPGEGTSPGERTGG